MEVTVISSTVQKFNGESFYLCGNYFQHKGKRLHRTVWEFHNGAIPDGYHVHHKDENRSNNQIDNLVLLKESEHLHGHMMSESRREKSRRDIAYAIAKAPEWHGSTAGKEWHSQQSKNSWKKRTPMTYQCSFCGKEFTTLHHYGDGMNHFCHPNCKAAYRRRRVRNEG